VSIISFLPLPSCLAINFISDNIEPPEVQYFTKPAREAIKTTQKTETISQLFLIGSLYLLSAKTNSLFSFKNNATTKVKITNINPIIHIHFNLPTRSCGLSFFSSINDVTIEINVAEANSAIIGGKDNNETVANTFFLAYCSLNIKVNIEIQLAPTPTHIA
jgi:hypothetical protein